MYTPIIFFLSLFAFFTRIDFHSATFSYQMTILRATFNSYIRKNG